jgi:hypothetical protein
MMQIKTQRPTNQLVLQEIVKLNFLQERRPAWRFRGNYRLEKDKKNQKNKEVCGCGCAYFAFQWQFKQLAL